MLRRKRSGAILMTEKSSDELVPACKQQPSNVPEQPFQVTSLVPSTRISRTTDSIHCHRHSESEYGPSKHGFLLPIRPGKNVLPQLLPPLDFPRFLLPLLLFLHYS